MIGVAIILLGNNLFRHHIFILHITGMQRKKAPKQSKRSLHILFPMGHHLGSFILLGNISPISNRASVYFNDDECSNCVEKYNVCSLKELFLFRVTLVKDSCLMNVRPNCFGFYNSCDK